MVFSMDFVTTMKNFDFNRRSIHQTLCYQAGVMTYKEF